MTAPLFPPAEALSHHADADAVDSFIAWRKARKKPLTDRAAKMIGKTLADINAAGGDATEALDLAQEHGWLTIKSEWYWRQKNGNGSSKTGNGPGGASKFDEARERAMRSAARGPERGACGF